MGINFARACTKQLGILALGAVFALAIDARDFSECFFMVISLNDVLPKEEELGFLHHVMVPFDDGGEKKWISINSDTGLLDYDFGVYWHDGNQRHEMGQHSTKSSIAYFHEPDADGCFGDDTVVALLGEWVNGRVYNYEQPSITTCLPVMGQYLVEAENKPYTTTWYNWNYGVCLNRMSGTFDKAVAGMEYVSWGRNGSSCTMYLNQDLRNVPLNGGIDMISTWSCVRRSVKFPGHGTTSVRWDISYESANSLEECERVVQKYHHPSAAALTFNRSTSSCLFTTETLKGIHIDPESDSTVMFVNQHIPLIVEKEGDSSSSSSSSTTSTSTTANPSGGAPSDPDATGENQQSEAADESSNTTTIIIAASAGGGAALLLGSLGLYCCCTRERSDDDDEDDGPAWGQGNTDDPFTFGGYARSPGGQRGAAIPPQQYAAYGAGGAAGRGRGYGAQQPQQMYGAGRGYGGGAQPAAGHPGLQRPPQGYGRGYPQGWGR